VLLGTGGRALAEKRAIALQELLREGGWSAVDGSLGGVGPSGAAGKKSGKPKSGSIGDYLERVRRSGLLEPTTLLEYERCFNRILLDTFCPGEGRSTAEWRRDLAKLHDRPLEHLTPKILGQWQARMLAHEGGIRPISHTTINSRMRCAKALFSARVRRTLGHEHPSPFEGISFLREGSHRYVSRFDGRRLLAMAREELPMDGYVVLVLAICAGMRRNEIDKLLWEQVDLARGIISIYATAHFTPKSAESCSAIPLDAAVVELLSSWRSRVQGDFVIPSPIVPRPERRSRHSRCLRLFKHLAKWLRSNGVRFRCPLHTLRKEYGAEICRRHGLYAASRSLRHSTYAVKEKYYVDSSAFATPGFL
jgi:integrase